MINDRVFTYFTEHCRVLQYSRLAYLL